MRTLVLLSFCVVAVAGFGFGGGGGGCGCGAPPPPPCPPPPPSPCGCGRKKRETKAFWTNEAVCNDEALRELIHENAAESAAKSRLAIYQAVQKRQDGEYAVLCQEGHSDLPFVTSAEKFCRAKAGRITCYVFQL